MIVKPVKIVIREKELKKRTTKMKKKQLKVIAKIKRTKTLIVISIILEKEHIFF